MSEEKFTKGPWQVDDDEGALRLFVYSEEYGNVCSVSLFDQRDREAVLLGETPEDNPDRKEYLDFDKITANAALIAAAPEMYDFIHFFETFSGQAYLRIFPDAAGRKIYEDAVRLCKKARGEQ